MTATAQEALGKERERSQIYKKDFASFVIYLHLISCNVDKINVDKNNAGYTAIQSRTVRQS